MKCEICEDTGITEKNGRDVKCKCVYEMQLKKMLPAELLSKDKFGKDKYEIEIGTVKTILENRSKLVDKVYYTAPISNFFSMIKSIAYTEIVKNNGNFTMDIISPEDVHSVLFSSDGNISSYYSKDFLAIVYRKGTQENKMIVPALEQIMLNRQVNGKTTLIWIDPDIHIKTSSSGLYYDQVNLEKYKEFGYKLFKLPYNGKPVQGSSLLPEQTTVETTKKRGY